MERPTVNPSPGLVHPETWRFWLALRRMEPQGQLGGVYANKRSYHNTVRANQAWWPNDYSVRLPRDQRGCLGHARALDWTLPAAQMKKYTQRVWKVMTGPDDPRLDGVRECIGTTDGRTARAYDATLNEWRTADESHLWHIHFSFRSDLAHERRTYDGLLSILRGESLATWKAAQG